MTTFVYPMAHEPAAEVGARRPRDATIADMVAIRAPFGVSAFEERQQSLALLSPHAKYLELGLRCTF